MLYLEANNCDAALCSVLLLMQYKASGVTAQESYTNMVESESWLQETRLRPTPILKLHTQDTCFHIFNTRFYPLLCKTLNTLRQISG